MWVVAELILCITTEQNKFTPSFSCTIYFVLGTDWVKICCEYKHIYDKTPTLTGCKDVQPYILKFLMGDETNSFLKYKTKYNKYHKTEPTVLPL